ncbi:MAG: hypothetical protein IJN86_01220 [Clostridia bacterium]|nr:hypothetical protein [Clostridia bacterium]
MKKIIGIISLIALVAALLISCGGSFVCGMCEEEKSGKKHTEKIFGEELTICDDCYEGLKALGDLAG